MRPVRSTSWSKQISKKMHRAPVRRKIVRSTFIGVNVLLLLGISFFVLHARTTGAVSILAHSQAAATDQTSVNPLDQVSSADIAVSVARVSGLTESVAVKNSAESADSQLQVAPVNDNVVSKPQVVATAFKSKNDIQSYVVQAGDTVSNIATKFGVTSDSIRWSNSLTGDSVSAGTKLWVPPHGLSGIVYTVKVGDTLDGLAQKYKADKAQLVAANDAEINGIQTGERIIIPNGQAPAAPVSARSFYTSSYAFGSSAIYGYNGYDYGWCTWYVANKIAVPSNWGNADTWDNLAPLSGWTVSSTPKPGAIAQTDRGSEGHVAYVEAVSDDGTMMKYSDMNGLAGWGRVGYSDWVSISKFEHYIYH